MNAWFFLIFSVFIITIRIFDSKIVYRKSLSIFWVLKVCFPVSEMSLKNDTENNKSKRVNVLVAMRLFMVDCLMICRFNKKLNWFWNLCSEVSSIFSLYSFNRLQFFGFCRLEKKIIFRKQKNDKTRVWCLVVLITQTILRLQRWFSFHMESGGHFLYAWKFHSYCKEYKKDWKKRKKFKIMS